jgi:hypothetical protein
MNIRARTSVPTAIARSRVQLRVSGGQQLTGAVLVAIGYHPVPLSQFDLGIRPAPARGVIRCDGEEVILYSGQMLGDFTVAVAHFETMREKRTVLHVPPPRRSRNISTGRRLARRIFWTRGGRIRAHALHASSWLLRHPLGIKKSVSWRKIFSKR